MGGGDKEDESRSKAVEAEPLDGWSLCRALVDQGGDDEPDLLEPALRFSKGQIIKLTDRMDHDWWEGITKDGSKGCFPSNRVEFLPESITKEWWQHSEGKHAADVRREHAKEHAASRKEVHDLKREMEELKEGLAAEKLRKLTTTECSKRCTFLTPHKVTRAKARVKDTKPSRDARPKSRSKLKRHKKKCRRIKRKSRRRKSKRKSRRRTK